MKNFFLFIILFVITSIYGQTKPDLSYYLPQNITYNSQIPTPESVLGFQVGEWHATHDKLVYYLQKLSEVSDRISMEERGKTFEGRPLLLLTITSPENQQQLGKLRNEHLQFTDAESRNLLNAENMPLVVYQGFSIHGNEASGANASLLLAYYLAAAEGTEIELLLSNTIILLDPSLNPDGLQRFAGWVNSNKSENLNTDANDREFHEVWPGGRTNHYWFDMNRDWLPVQLPESKARIASFRKWMPNLLTDHHEMGSNSTFFFQPGIQSRVHPLTPALNQELTREIGKYHAKALDKIGSLYYTEENYDDFYYGKGSTYPDINGSIGILFEQGSSRGHAQETDNGVLTFPFAIRNQFTTALSTLEAGEEMRVKLLNYQRDFYVNATKNLEKNKTKALVFGDHKDAAKVFHLAEILNRHEIQLYKPIRDFSKNGVNFKKESSYMVPLNQKNGKLLTAMFEKRTSFTDSLFYDVSAWSFQLAFNVDYTELNSTDYLGEKVFNISLKDGFVSSKSNYAYVMEWHEYYAPKALNKMLQKGISVKLGMKPFTIDQGEFDYGTILIPVQNQSLNKEELYSFLQETAKESHTVIHGVSTGLTQGINLGSNQFKTIKKQQVAMIVGNGVYASDAGEIWHLFDQRYQMNVTKLDVDGLSRVDISNYTSIILPSSNLKVDEKTVNKLKSWTQNGGNLIAYKNSIHWLLKNKFISVEIDSVHVKANSITFEQKNDFKGAQVIGGAIFETKLDRSHPINFGYHNEYLPMFRRTKIFMKPDSLSYNNPIKYTDNPLLSGYISKPNLNVLKNTVPFQTKKLGKGRVTVFTDNTNFRAFWYGTNKLLMNAIFFNEAM